MACTASAQSDKTSIFIESFDADGRTRAASLCVDGKCSQVEEAPFINAAKRKVNVLSICGATGFAPMIGTLTNDSEVREIDISQPSKLDFTLTTAQSSSGFSASVVGSEVDRILVWAGRFTNGSTEPFEILWTSESHPVGIIRRPTAISIELTPTQFRGCADLADCKIVMQAVRSERLAKGRPTLISMSEDKRVLYSAVKAR